MKSLGKQLTTIFSNKKYIFLSFATYATIGIFLNLLALYLIYSNQIFNLSTTNLLLAIVLFFLGVIILILGFYYILHIPSKVFLYENGIIFNSRIYLFEELGPITWKKEHYKFLKIIKTPYTFMYVSNISNLNALSDLWYKNAHFIFIQTYQNNLKKATLLIKNKAKHN